MPVLRKIKKKSFHLSGLQELQSSLSFSWDLQRQHRTQKNVQKLVHFYTRRVEINPCVCVCFFIGRASGAAAWGCGVVGAAGQRHHDQRLPQRRETSWGVRGQGLTTRREAAVDAGLNHGSQRESRETNSLCVKHWELAAWEMDSDSLWENVGEWKIC